MKNPLDSPIWPEDLPELKGIREKGNWKGIEAWVVGILVWIGELLHVQIATTFMEEFHTELGGYHWYPRGQQPPGPDTTIIGHERVHLWQKENVHFYRTRWLFSRTWRAQLEAMAYAWEVVHGRPVTSASRAMAQPIYRLGLSELATEQLITVYALRIEHERMQGRAS